MNKQNITNLQMLICYENRIWYADFISPKIRQEVLIYLSSQYFESWPQVADHDFYNYYENTILDFIVVKIKRPSIVVAVASFFKSALSLEVWFLKFPVLLHKTVKMPVVNFLTSAASFLYAVSSMLTGAQNNAAVQQSFVSNFQSSPTHFLPVGQRTPKSQTNNDNPHLRDVPNFLNNNNGSYYEYHQDVNNQGGKDSSVSSTIL